VSQHPVRIDGEHVTTDASITIRAPYDGQVVGEVPRCSAQHVDRAVAAAARVMAEEPLPAWKRAAILDRAATLLAVPEVADELARSIALEAAKPITTARTEVERSAGAAVAVVSETAGRVDPVGALRQD
jgi:acyl-CoA reductase-like NAD-dependent aldehyde dehydrogenase